MKKLLSLLSTSFLLTTCLVAQQTMPLNGTHDVRHSYYAFTHAHIYQDYATVLDDATLLIKDGNIIDIGTNVTLPKGTVVYDCKGKTIYPSFIDLYTSYGMPAIPADKRPHKGFFPQMTSTTPGAYDANQAIRPEENAEQSFNTNSADAAQYRNLGFGVALTSYHDGIAQGSSALVTLADTNDHEAILNGKAAAGYSFNKGSSTEEYPTSLMGAIGVLRQAYYDAAWYKTSKHKTEYNISLETFNNLQSLPQIFKVDNKMSILRADKIAREFNVNYIIRGDGDEYQLLDAIKNTNRQFIVPLNFPDKPNVQDPYDALMVSTPTLMSWQMAALNPGAMEKAGLTFALTTDGLKDKNAFWVNLRKAVKFGLSVQGALKALTYTPAQMMHMQDKIGSLKKGMMANFIITSGDMFKPGTVIYSNWIRGNPNQVNDTTNIDLHGTYTLTINGNQTYTLQIKGDITNANAT
ncbi:MAG TPA: amidohydrolase family protein, partial [Bacteroidia bacterium]|nr:amidohydrolase family protein [Bacteroidia bacterium]